MRTFLIALGVIVVLALVLFWVSTEPRTLTADALPALDGDPARGEYLFHASGCASCHAAPKAKGPDKLKLGGGMSFATPFGTFRAPNISTDRTHGIGGWTALEFVNAVMGGVSPDGRHYYPSFPYRSYQHMKIADVVDLKAFMDTLPTVANDPPGHDLPLPFRFRRTIGLWKLLFMDDGPVLPGADAGEDVNRGAYLVNGPGHCGECHTPRNFLGAPENDWAFSGGPDPAGDGFIPNITPHEDGIGDWSREDIVSALKTGILPDFDTFGGAMIAVQENMAKLTPEDREAIAAYLMSLPPRSSRWKKPK